jgi:ribonuclease P protein component
MLRKNERLTTAEFNRSFSLGRRVHTPELQIITHPSPTFQAAAVVGKKVAKSAVRRNRLRRQLYGAIETVLLPDRPPLTVIVIAKPPLATLSHKAVMATAVKALQGVIQSR